MRDALYVIVCSDQTHARMRALTEFDKHSILYGQKSTLYRHNNKVVSELKDGTKLTTQCVSVSSEAIDGIIVNGFEVDESAAATSYLRKLDKTLKILRSARKAVADGRCIS